MLRMTVSLLPFYAERIDVLVRQKIKRGYRRKDNPLDRADLLG